MRFLYRMSFSAKLIKWYKINKRDLPWRETQDPYKVWLSEIILQQTRVDQGMSYYLKFVSLFPTVKKLADADEDTVLKAWQGLGYYSRARNLHATAKHIAYDLKGKFPSAQTELLKLKGVGAYTSAAIASFCFGEKAAVVDGNVMRVLTRLYGISEPIDSTEGKKIIDKLARESIDERDPGQYNQAIMEFGAIHCTPHNPLCASCPFNTNCEALAEGKVKELPVKSKKTAVKDIWMYYFFIQMGDKTYIRKRKDNGIWKGLHDFPLVESEGELKVENVISEFFIANKFDAKTEVLGISEEYIHILSHRKIHARFISIRLKSSWKLLPESVFEITLKTIDTYGVPRLIEKFLEKSNFASH